MSSSKTIGIIGGGQLGQMMAISAIYMGHKVIALDPAADCPASRVAEIIVAPYKGVTLGVVVASKGYPLEYEKGVALPAKTNGDIITYYAGAKFAENSRALLSNGGRVYMLVTTSDTVKESQETIYQELSQQKTEGLFYRTDIGSKAIR